MKLYKRSASFNNILYIYIIQFYSMLYNLYNTVYSSLQKLCHVQTYQHIGCIMSPVMFEPRFIVPRAKKMLYRTMKQR